VFRDWVAQGPGSFFGAAGERASWAAIRGDLVIERESCPVKLIPIEMTKVFIGGSRRMGRLNGEILEKLDTIMRQSFTILVGDAGGVDKAVQKHCSDKGYRNVTVYCAGGSCRNNLGGWETKHIYTERSIRDYRFYMAKDIEMAKEADYGFMIWDTRSSGTLSNMLELLEMEKKVVVYLGPGKTFMKLRRMEDLRRLLKVCSHETIRIFDSRFNLSLRLQMEASHPSRMIS